MKRPIGVRSACARGERANHVGTGRAMTRGIFGFSWHHGRAAARSHDHLHGSSDRRHQIGMIFLDSRIDNGHSDTRSTTKRGRGEQRIGHRFENAFELTLLSHD